MRIMGERVFFFFFFGPRNASVDKNCRMRLPTLNCITSHHISSSLGLVSWNMAKIDILSTCELWLPFPIFPIQIMKTPMRYNKSLVSHCTGEWFLYMGRVPLPAVSFLFFVLWWEGHFLLRWICCQAFHIYTDCCISGSLPLYLENGFSKVPWWF